MTDISVGGVKYGISVGTKPKTVENKQASNALSESAQKYIQTEDKVSESKQTKGSIPQVDNNISNSLNSEKGTLTVGNHSYTNIRKLTKGIELEDAKKIVTGNKVDEVFFKDEQGQLYVAFGKKEQKGALELDYLKEGYIGKFGDKTVKVVHIDNEINTVKEGALSPLNSTWKNVKDAGSSGIAKGVTEMGTTLVAIFVGKSVIENGITAVTAAKGAETVGGVAKGGINLIDKGSKIVNNAGKTGKAIATTVGSGAQKLVIGAAFAGIVVGAVVGTMSAYGAIQARKPKNDFTTIDMITNPGLSYNATQPK